VYREVLWALWNSSVLHMGAADVSAFSLMPCYFTSTKMYASLVSEEISLSRCFLQSFELTVSIAFEAQGKALSGWTTLCTCHFVVKQGIHIECSGQRCPRAWRPNKAEDMESIACIRLLGSRACFPVACRRVRTVVGAEVILCKPRSVYVPGQCVFPVRHNILLRVACVHENPKNLVSSMGKLLSESGLKKYRLLYLEQVDL